MYKVEVEDIDRKIQAIKKTKYSAILVILIGAMLLIAAIEKEVMVFAILSAWFCIAFVKHYLIDPLLGKITLLEEEIINLKEKTDTEDLKRY